MLHKLYLHLVNKGKTSFKLVIENSDYLNKSRMYSLLAPWFGNGLLLRFEPRASSGHAYSILLYYSHN